MQGELPGVLKDCVAVVVGATSGMGRATALRLGRSGAKLALVGRRAVLLQELAEQLAVETGQAALGLTCDVRSRDDVAAMIRAAQVHFGRIDVLIYASGINTKLRAIDKLTPEVWSDLIDTNLNGAFYCTEQVLPVMREQGGGLIVYVSSISAKRGDVSGIAYQASKRALDGLAAGVTIEQKKFGIRTSVIYPGLTDTPLLANRPYQTPQEELDNALQPEDVAECCHFLASMPARAHVPELVLMPTKP